MPVKYRREERDEAADAGRGLLHRNWSRRATVDTRTRQRRLWGVIFVSAFLIVLLNGLQRRQATRPTPAAPRTHHTEVRVLETEALDNGAVRLTLRLASGPAAGRSAETIVMAEQARLVKDAAVLRATYVVGADGKVKVTALHAGASSTPNQPGSVAPGASG